MEQHLRFIDSAPSGVAYRAFGLRGHTLDVVVYVLTAIGGGAIAWVKNGFSLWYLLPAALVLGVLWHARLNERHLWSAHKRGFRVQAEGAATRP